MFLALREIARSRIRFALLSGAVGLLVFLITFQQALFAGLITSFVGAVENQNAPILVLDDQARRNVEGSFLVPEQVDAVSRVEGVAAAGPIGESTFTVFVERNGAVVDEDAVLFGYELGGLGEPDTLVRGRLPEGPDEAVASERNVDDGFGLGATIEIAGENGPRIEVVGLGRDLQWSVAPTLFVSFDTFAAAQRAVNPDAEVVLPSIIGVQPEPGIDPGALTTRIDREVPGVEALTRERAVQENPGVQGVSNSANVILGLAFLVVTLVVAFFFLILTSQNAMTTTLLRAIGARPAYLVRALILQIVVVMAAGVALGVVLTLAVDAAARDSVPTDLDPATLAATVGAVTALALGGGLVSIRRVLRVDPLRATVNAGRTL